MNRLATGLLACCLAALSTTTAAFCGFYVGKTDAKLFNLDSSVSRSARRLGSA